MQTASASSKPSASTLPTRPPSKRIPFTKEQALQGSELARLARLRRKGEMSKEEFIKRLESLIRSDKTPTQYLAGLSSLLADVKMWKRQVGDGQSKAQLDEMVNEWKREDAGEYAGMLNQVRSDNGAICQPASSVGEANERMRTVLGSVALPTPHSCPTCSCARVLADKVQASATDAARPGGSPQAESATGAFDPLPPPTSPEKPSLTADSKPLSDIQPTSMWEEE